MINKFTVSANSERNELAVKMDGYFMNSEIDLAAILVKNEIKKLIPGFTLMVDIGNLILQRSKNLNTTEWIDSLGRSLGAGEIRHAGVNVDKWNFPSFSVGFYPYENEWFF